ncbi:putative inorganic carbon transporter subunit DabA [Staphylococcus ureilyticus]
MLLTAWEATYEHQLEATVTTNQDNEQESQKPQVQMAFCIDVRSEPFRRQIEAAGAFETIGVAGFFGLPIVKEELGQSHSHPSLPVMNQPQHKIKEYTHEQEPTSFASINTYSNR